MVKVTGKTFFVLQTYENLKRFIKFVNDKGGDFRQILGNEEMTALGEFKKLLRNFIKPTSKISKDRFAREMIKLRKLVSIVEKKFNYRGMLYLYRPGNLTKKQYIKAMNEDHDITSAQLSKLKSEGLVVEYAKSRRTFGLTISACQKLPVKKVKSLAQKYKIKLRHKNKKLKTKLELCRALKKKTSKIGRKRSRSKK